ncbi:MAG: hypothetical protein ACOC2U_01105 [bacterium]
MSLDRETRNDVEKMIDDKIKHSENIIILKMEMFDTKLDIVNNNIVNYIAQQEQVKRDIVELQKKELTKKENCPWKKEIIDSTKYVNQIKTIKNYNLKMIGIASTVLAIINALLIYLL